MWCRLRPLCCWVQKVSVHYGLLDFFGGKGHWCGGKEEGGSEEHHHPLVSDTPVLALCEYREAIGILALFNCRMFGKCCAFLCSAAAPSSSRGLRYPQPCGAVHSPTWGSSSPFMGQLFLCEDIILQLSISRFDGLWSCLGMLTLQMHVDLFLDVFSDSRKGGLCQSCGFPRIKGIITMS